MAGVGLVDYGVAGDLFGVVPQLTAHRSPLTEEVKTRKG